MKYGVREICDVVLKAKTATKIGNKIFYANEPVCYFDTLTTTTLEGAATTVYAQGGRGNARLIAWEGERTVTFTMEDALISPEGFMILSGAGLIDATESKPIYQHTTETIDASDITAGAAEGTLLIPLSEKPYLPTNGGADYAYVMLMKNGEIVSEPFIPTHGEIEADENGKYVISIENHDNYNTLTSIDIGGVHVDEDADGETYTANLANYAYDSVLVDYYVARESDAQQIEITADKFGGNYYLEASTLFRDTNGVDLPAEFIIPNCKVQSNFTFTMAATGDPSVFTFTMDAFPDYTRFDRSKKVLAALQIIKDAGSLDLHRHATAHEPGHEKYFIS